MSYEACVNVIPLLCFKTIAKHVHHNCITAGDLAIYPDMDTVHSMKDELPTKSKVTVPGFGGAGSGDGPGKIRLLFRKL